MELMIVTGISGAGKTVALKTLEDCGWYCVDNLPVFLLPQFAKLCRSSRDTELFAVGIDTRNGSGLERLPEALTELENSGIPCRILFLEAADRALIRRYKETRRTHPLAGEGRLEDGIRLEREALEWLRQKASYVIDTTSLHSRDLKLELTQILSGEHGTFRSLVVSILSFGFKYGIPEDADLVFDVRFLPNPFYLDDLKEKTGFDPEVRAYSLENETGKAFMNHLTGLLDFLLPNYVREGKTRLLIAVGCTGGKHRSVAVAEELKHHFSSDGSFAVSVQHRDMNR